MTVLPNSACARAAPVGVTASEPKRPSPGAPSSWAPSSCIGTDANAGAEVDDASNSILSGLSTADLMSPAGDLRRRGSLVLVVSGAGAEDESQRDQNADHGIAIAHVERHPVVDGDVGGWKKTA
jgi:hypothetical protein